MEKLYTDHCMAIGMDPDYDNDLVYDKIILDALGEYGATTDLKDENDPLWFDNQESLTHFVLTWSR